MPYCRSCEYSREKHGKYNNDSDDSDSDYEQDCRIERKCKGCDDPLIKCQRCERIFLPNEGEYCKGCSQFRCDYCSSKRCSSCKTCDTHLCGDCVNHSTYCRCCCSSYNCPQCSEYIQIYHCKQCKREIICPTCYSEEKVCFFCELTNDRKTK